MPTTVTVTVDDGSNLASPDYSSLSAAEAGEQRDLVAADEIAELECYGFVDAEVTFGGWTTSPTQYVQVRVADGHRHGGVWTGDGSAYVLSPSTGFPLTINAEHDVRCDGVQFDRTADNAFNPTAISSGHDGTASTDCRFSDCLVRYGQLGSGSCKAFNGGSTSSSNEFRWRNCVFWGAEFSADSSADLFQDNAGTHWVHNVTAHVVSGAGTVDAVLESGFGELHATNTRVSGVATFGSTSSDSDFNLSEDGSAPGSNSLTGETSDYVDAPNGDFHLSSGDPGVDAGTDLSGDADYPVTTDFEGDSRPQGSGWDIGADEFVPSAEEPTFQPAWASDVNRVIQPGGGLL